MLAEATSDPRLEIGHVLFVDIVAYSKLVIDEQREAQRKLNEIVRSTEQFDLSDTTGKLVRLPTGDGMALVFRDTIEAPVRCATQIAKSLGAHPGIHLRMGIHSGPVSDVTDVNERANIAGDGVNIAQRVMSCGDARHILVSKRVAEDLAHYGRWRSQFHELGEVEIKHGVKIDIFNLCGDGIGNPEVPEKIARKREELETASRALAKRSRARRRTYVGIAAGVVALAIALSIFAYRTSRKLAEATNLGKTTFGKSIAVLPFENLSPDKDDAFFADGIQDDVLTTLGKVKELTVIARSSVMRYRGAAVAGKLREVGNALGVSHVLEGSVRRSANRVVINVQLIDTRDDHQMWSERYDRTLTDSIGLQGELAGEIARELRAKLSPEEKARLASKLTDNPEAYVLYLQALEKEKTEWDQLPPVDAVDALYDRAIALDSHFASAMARQSVWNCGFYRQTHDQKFKRKAQALAVEALRIAPDLPEAHIALGEWFRMTERNYDAALKEFEIVARTSPNDPEILGHLGVLYRRQGRWREALENFHRAQELDPRIPHEDEAQTAVAVRDWKTARVLYKRLLKLAPDDTGIKTNFASALMNGEGDFAAARALLEAMPYPRYDTSGEPIWADLVPRWQLLMLERDYVGAEKLLVDFPAEEFSGVPALKNMFLGVSAWAKGDQNSAGERFEKVQTAWESALRERPNDLSYMAHLGMLYASVGRKEDAVRLSQRALDLLPANDAIERPAYSGNIALVYAWTGEPDKAVTLVEQLLTKPAVDIEGFEPLTLTILRSWKWDRLRGNLRFEKILAGPEPKTIY